MSYILPWCGYTVYEMLFWFFSYSIMGWCVESLYMSFCNRRLTNRGFIHGPICPIYGVGGMSVHLILKPLSGNYFVLYIAGAVFATALEYCTARLMIKLFGYVWWDYSNKPYNYKSLICLESTIAWGFYTVLEFALFQKVVFSIMDRVPEMFGKTLVVAIVIYFLIDMSYCLLHAKKGEIEADENNLLAVK